MEIQNYGEVMTTILREIKEAIGIQPDNFGFDTPTLMFINSTKSTLVQLGVDELDVPIVEQTEWPVFTNPRLLALVKHYFQIKVKAALDPVPSETIAKGFAATASELEGRIMDEVFE